MGNILVHEFTTLDGVIDAPTWTFDFGFDGADGLIDELHLFVFPLTVGTGPRLFAEGQSPSKFTLARTEASEKGVLYLSYRPLH